MQSNDIWQQYLKGKIAIDESKYIEPAEVEQIEELILDLHHLTEDRAFDVLRSTILRSYKHKIQRILIITGMNVKNNQITGILYNRLPKWLSHSDISGYIKDFTYQQGNKGAVIVRLKL